MIIALLLVSTLLAYRVQLRFSEQSMGIHRRFVQQQELLTNMRAILWQTGTVLRDHFLSPSHDPVALSLQLQTLSNHTDHFITDLRRISDRKEAVAALEFHMTEFWGTVGNVAGQEWTSDQAHRFLQDEIVTRREEAEKLLRRIDQANQSSLADSEAQFLATRTAATKRLVIVLGVCLFLGVAVVHFSVKYSENLERESADRFTELVEANRQLEGLSARLMEVQEEERTRLSRELHDEIVQNLAVLKMEIIQAQRLTAMSGIAREPLLRARELAERTVKTVRDISVLLRPSLLDDLGLCPALQWQAEEFSRRTGVHCDFSGDEIEETLPDAIKTCVYRVTQEALRNCEKHSRASRVQVAIRRHSGKLVVQVEDNGVGFPSSGAKSPRSLGLVGMRERAAIVGGALTVENKSTGGAIVRLSVPLPARTEVREMVEARA